MKAAKKMVALGDFGGQSSVIISDVIDPVASLRELWLTSHPGLSIDEALRRYRDEQKQRQRVRLKHQSAQPVCVCTAINTHRKAKQRCKGLRF